MSGTPGLPRPEGTLEKAILEATLAALERDGEAKLRMRDVAQAVGCSVGLLYHHYGDREGLIEVARVKQFEGLLDQDIRTTEAALEACQSAEEFRARLSSLAKIGSGPERAEKRRQRIVVLGAAIQRPARSRPSCSPTCWAASSVTSISAAPFPTRTGVNWC